MTWERPLRELTGVPDDRDEAEEVESEPWDEDFSVPFATEEKHIQVLLEINTCMYLSLSNVLKVYA